MNIISFKIVIPLLVFVTALQLRANPSKDENALYAAASILYYLDALNVPSISTITFTPDDINDLFKALEASSLSKEATRAKNDLFDQKLEEAQEQLTNIWTQLVQKHSSTPLTLPDCKIKNDQKNNFSKVFKYLLPDTHPVKCTLDILFLNYPSALKNNGSFSEAGFLTLHRQPWSYIVVAKHPQVPGYIFKGYLDSEVRKKDGKPGWTWLIKRCLGAENIRQLIQKKGLKYFSVPDKWLYRAPCNAKIILVATDMDLVTEKETEEAWKNLTSRQLLRELYIILSHGYASCELIANIPYSKNGTFSCIDTEYPQRNLKPKFDRVKLYLSEDFQNTWDELVRKGGK